MMGSFCGVDVFIFLKGKRNEEIWVFPEWVGTFGKKLGMGFCTRGLDYGFFYGGEIFYGKEIWLGGPG
jgi:hypothetical protein